ncbi:MAG: cyclic nucleotide-binding domain-containing protein [Bacteroidota bacterium]
MKQNQITSFITNYLNGMKALSVSDESIDRIREVIEVIRVKSKDTLIIPGEICRHVYVIVQGGFICRYIHEKTGEANTINFYLPDLHPVMACLDSFFTQTPTNCELKSIGDSYVVALPKTMVDVLNREDEFFRAFYHELVITALTGENELKTKLIAYSSQEKYDYIIEEMPSVIQAVPSKYVAEFCGISPGWLSKLKRKG